MSDSITIQPLPGPFEVTLRPPGSKSLTNRALLLAALAEGESTIRYSLEADDTRRMLEALPRLGFDVQEVAEAVRIRGAEGRIPAKEADLFLGNAGTAMRPLCAACCLGFPGPGAGAGAGTEGGGVYRLDGVARMRERPIGELVDPLRALGADIRYVGEEGYPPLEIRPRPRKVDGGGLRGGTITMRPTLSSQFISALAMIAPCTREGITIRFQGPITSKPYVELTLGLMAKFGVQAAFEEGDRLLRIAPGRYQATTYEVEPDASSASYFLAAAAMTPGSRCTIEGLGHDSLQGDVAFVDVLAKMGAQVTWAADRITVAAPEASEDPEGGLRGVDVDCNHIPDAAMTLATLAVVAQGPTIIRNVGNWRVKETDRMAAMEKELTKVGADVRVEGDDITIVPPEDGRLQHAAIDTYDDHRMAMSFAILGLVPGVPGARLPGAGITINDPRCVDKTFPTFFDYLERLRQAAR